MPPVGTGAPTRPRGAPRPGQRGAQPDPPGSAPPPGQWGRTPGRPVGAPRPTPEPEGQGDPSLPHGGPEPQPTPGQKRPHPTGTRHLCPPCCEGWGEGDSAPLLAPITGNSPHTRAHPTGEPPAPPPAPGYWGRLHIPGHGGCRAPSHPRCTKLEGEKKKKKEEPPPPHPCKKPASQPPTGSRAGTGGDPAPPHHPAERSTRVARPVPPRPVHAPAWLSSSL